MTEPEFRTRIGFALLIFLLGMVVGWALAEGNCSQMVEHPRPTSRTTAHPDSAFVPITIATNPISIRARSNVHRADTSLVDSTIHSVACIDTLLIAPSAKLPDTLHVCYDPPSDSFAIDMRFAARDTTLEVRYITHDSIIEHTQMIESEKKVWYVEPVEILGSIVFGFLLGNLKK